ncbi:hypothetical protein [Streptomyces sp. NBC_01643]|uniref:hypothetical protein n=1 Tax=Streptomyces sp. NBC_01643 TaxID=2975906 RepID=UPI00386FEE73|nr:hypothetical protein OHB03_39065 [Streptomyces sp. NBC_01643]
MIDKNPSQNDYGRGALRFLTELIAWVGAPWALWPHSIALAIGAVVILIGLPAVFSTPGDRPGGGTPVLVPGIVTILLVLMQLAAATAATWALWPWWAATAATVLCLTVTVTEQPRWRWLLSAPGNPTGAQPGRSS